MMAVSGGEREGAGGTRTSTCQQVRGCKTSIELQSVANRKKAYVLVLGLVLGLQNCCKYDSRAR